MTIELNLTDDEWNLIDEVATRDFGGSTDKALHEAIRLLGVDRKDNEARIFDNIPFRLFSICDENGLHLTPEDKIYGHFCSTCKKEKDCDNVGKFGANFKYDCFE